MFTNKGVRYKSAAESKRKDEVNIENEIEKFKLAFINLKISKRPSTQHTTSSAYIKTVADCVSNKAKLKRIFPIPFAVNLYATVEALQIRSTFISTS